MLQAALLSARSHHRNIHAYETQSYPLLPRDSRSVDRNRLKLQCCKELAAIITRKWQWPRRVRLSTCTRLSQSEAAVCVRANTGLYLYREGLRDAPIWRKFPSLLLHVFMQRLIGKVSVRAWQHRNFKAICKPRLKDHQTDDFSIRPAASSVARNNNIRHFAESSTKQSLF